MSRSNRRLGHSFKELAIIALLSLTPTGVVLQAQADDTAKQSVSSSVQSQSPMVGLININSANAEELASALSGVGLAKATAIVAWRQQHGQFERIEDLLKVKGIGEKILDANAEKIGL